MLRACKIKNPAYEGQLYRYFTLEPTPAEKKAWIKLGVWRRGKPYMTPEEIEDPAVTFALWHLSLMGLLNRIVVQQ